MESLWESLRFSLNKQDMAQDAVGLLDALGIQQAHIVGISMGRAIAQLVAIAGSNYTTDEVTLRKRAERDFERGYDPDGLTRQQTVSLIGHLDSARYRLSNLEKIEVPTVVLQGTDDPIVPVASAEDIAVRVPDAELRIVPGMGHYIPVVLVPMFADAITAAATGADRQVQDINPDDLNK
jgi:pimeloyl-ACP methyl ester carboxylesterase